MSFFAELKRRNVFRAGIAYGLIAWVVLQIVDFLVQLIGAPNWVLQVFFIAAAVGLLAVLVLSWVFEMTPDGVKREAEVDRTQSITPQTGRKMDRIIIAALAVAVVMLVGERFMPGTTPVPQTQSATETGADPVTIEAQDRSVAVLPFVALSSGEEDGYFADGLTEEILNALAQLPELQVTARTSSFAFKGQDIAVEEIAETLGVRHVVEGSVRRSGERLRVSAQLIRAQDGFQLWSESYDSSSADTITVQEDIAEQIAGALDVVLDEDRRAAMRQVGLRDPTAFVAYQRGLDASRKAHGDANQITGLLAANADFEAVLERVPDYAPAYTELADAYVHIILDEATNEPTLGGVPDNVRERAYELAVDAMTAANENARSLDERSNSEFDLAVLTGDFYRIKPRLEAYLASDHCDVGQWLDPVAIVFGYAQELRERLVPVVECNPLDAVRRFSQARAAIWAGDPEGALELLSAAREKIDHPWLNKAYIDALIAAGRLESAQQEWRRSDAEPFYKFINGIRLAGVQGDEAAGAERLDELKQSEGILTEADIGGFLMLQYHALMGDHEAANRLAATIDEEAFGPLPLILITTWCGCGAPFDIEATPNFASKIEQGGLAWPPPSTIELPLKDW